LPSWSKLFQYVSKKTKEGYHGSDSQIMPNVSKI